MARRVALACLLMPGALTDPKLAAQFAETGAKAAPSKDAWPHITRAASLYRQGKFADAVKPLQDALKLAPSDSAGEALAARLLLAMADHRLGKAKEARSQLDQGAREMDKLAAAKEIAPIRKDTPQTWAICIVLRREAESLLKN